MNPRLVAIAGPLKDSTFALPESGRLSIGRDSANVLPIADPSVSRQHCALEAEAGGFAHECEFGDVPATPVIEIDWISHFIVSSFRH